jgi:hypothetical protein
VEDTATADEGPDDTRSTLIVPLAAAPQGTTLPGARSVT